MGSEFTPRVRRALLARAETWLLVGVGLVGMGIGAAHLPGAWQGVERGGCTAAGLGFLFLFLRERRARLKAVRAQQTQHDELEAFVATISHDLRTPLTAVLGFSQILCDDEPRDRDRQRNYYAIIRGQAEHLARMIEDVVDLARLADRSLPLRPASLRAAELIDNALVQYLPAAERGRIQVRVHPDAPPLWADRYECEQVLDRLCHTALTMAGPTSPPLTLTAVPLGDLVCFACHIPGGAARLDALQPLMQTTPAPPALARASERGLDLLVARALVEVQGGRVWVEKAEAAEDALLCFTLPSAETAPVAADALAAVVR